MGGDFSFKYILFVSKICFLENSSFNFGDEREKITLSVNLRHLEYAKIK